MKIVLLDSSTLGSDIDLSVLNNYGNVISYDTTSAAQTLARVKDVDIVITNKVVIDKAIMIESQIKLICVAATGMNNIDLIAAKELGIEVKNVAGYSTDSVVQTTFSLAFYLLGKLRFYDDYTKNGRWSKSKIFTNLDKPFRNIKGMTWGIIGLGKIGKGVGKVAKAFGAEVIYYSTSGRNRDSDFQRASLEDLLKTSDIISIHSPLNEQTKGLINKDNLMYLKKEAILLNLGRGGIIEERELATYMNESDILVGLDVLEHEPMREDSPFNGVECQDNLLITPHVAWASVESREKLLKGIEENIKSFLGGIA